jgi:hypothetical protein
MEACPLAFVERAAVRRCWTPRAQLVRVARGLASWFAISAIRPSRGGWRLPVGESLGGECICLEGSNPKVWGFWVLASGFFGFLWLFGWRLIRFLSLISLACLVCPDEDNGGPSCLGAERNEFAGSPHQQQLATIR